MNFKLITLTVPLLSFLLCISACDKEPEGPFRCYNPTAAANEGYQGPDCECTERNDRRTMGANNELCLYLKEIQSVQQTQIARGNSGVYFVILNERPKDLFSDTVFMWPLTVVDLERTVPGDTVFYWDSFVFGQYATVFPDVYSHIDSCSDAQDRTYTDLSHSYSGGLRTSNPGPKFKAGDEWNLTWFDVDWDNDCNWEFARVFGTMHSELHGTGHLIWYDFTQQDSSVRYPQDTIDFRIEAMPIDW